MSFPLVAKLENRTLYFLNYLNYFEILKLLFFQQKLNNLGKKKYCSHLYKYSSRLINMKQCFHFNNMNYQNTDNHNDTKMQTNKEETKTRHNEMQYE